jgi:formate hydrogenlyase subunit 4
MNAYALFAQLMPLVAPLVLAPLLTGWVNQCRAWLQNRSAPPLLQTYYTLSKLFHKDVLLAHNASSLFRAAPYIIFSCMALASAIVPTLSTDLIFAPAADAIALVGLFAWRACSSRWPAWTSAPPSARSARAARC